MLARANRVVLPADFRSVVRRGRRSSTPGAVIYRLTTHPESPARFGVIASRAVGHAVDRNRVRRRVKAIARQAVDAGFRGEDVVVRLLPGSPQRDWDSLWADVNEALGGLIPHPDRRTP